MNYIKYIMKIIIIILSLVLIISCNSSKNSTADKSNNISNNIIIKDSSDQIKPEIQQINNNVEPLFNSASYYHNLIKFSLNMFTQLNKNNVSNTVFSPVSLNIALSLLYPGTKNNTANELKKVIGYKDKIEDFYYDASSYNNYIASYAEEQNFEFAMANKLYIEQSFSILNNYKDNIAKYFNSSSLQQVDFINNSAKEENNINNWVENITKARIKNLIPKNTLTTDTKFIIVNALYLKSPWKYPFDKKHTSAKPFYSNKNESIETDFMIQQTRGVKYLSNDSTKAIELPYLTSGLSLLIILPSNSNSINISSFIPNAETYLKICETLEYNDVYMEIPKFKIETSLNLSTYLKNLGIISAFSNRDADFSALSNTDKLYISAVLQKVFFEIDERGSEAAAATSIIVSTTSFNPTEIRMPGVFIANKPFIYILKENQYNTPLFMGIYKK